MTTTVYRRAGFRAEANELLDDGHHVAGPDGVAGHDAVWVKVPARVAAMWFSIFIASSTRIAWPTSTVAPTSTSTCTMVPCIGALTLPSPPAVPELVATRFGRARPAGGDRARTGASGNQTRTENLRPSTSTGTVRSTNDSTGVSPSVGSATGAAAAAGAANCAGSISSSSTHFVE